jgi:plasmid maintenance system antidote protein VapI
VAVKLARSFATTAEFWLNAQRAIDLWKVKEDGLEIPDRLRIHMYGVKTELL